MYRSGTQPPADDLQNSWNILASAWLGIPGGIVHGVSECATAANAMAAAAMASVATAAKINFFMRSLLVSCAGVARPGRGEGLS